MLKHRKITGLLLGAVITTHALCGFATVDPTFAQNISVVNTTAETRESKDAQKVIRQMQKYLGQSAGRKIVKQYNSFARNNQQHLNTAWCSEAVSVAAHRAGISKNIFPYFASASKGAGKFSDMDSFYVWVESQQAFVRATVTNNSSKHFRYILGTETYEPQAGDVLWTSADGKTPSHTALVVSAKRRKNGRLVMRTVEGNVSQKQQDRAQDWYDRYDEYDYDEFEYAYDYEEYDFEEYGFAEDEWLRRTEPSKRVVANKKRTAGNHESRYKKVFAIGRVHYQA